ncbi:GlxA family transcriptional regulator [Amycolatopsis sp. 195334CR]|uniref:GlxA family transcriptional regulator n=1 Tax=Amycolatopsis sp. 195334CR TaxID=2814588 RepID=UPI001A8D0D51|nr:GlxA family transcriptional regulator [Amycolatopsis sp. 195334CR]MBN6038836.1 GlxA family transcriptional regulator [Amycolatopsis sp. 195334CR]
MTTRQVLIVAFPEAELLDIACPSDVFDAANRLRAKPAYEIRLAGLDGKPIRCQSGLALAPQARLDQVTGPIDTLLVAGGFGHLAAAADGRMITQIRRLAGVSRRIASVCTGATLLAAAGVLTGRRCTTHWVDAPRLAGQHPEIEVDPAPLYVRDGNVYTSAGVTSGLDLALALVEADHGPSMARQIARYLVTYLQRPGNQAQVSMFLSAPPPEHGLVGDLTGYIASSLDADLGAPALAARAGLSTRQLTRLFDTHLGTTPARHVRRVRTEVAAQLLTTTELPLAAVARRCGFGSTESLRQAFLDHYDTPPSAYRRTHRRQHSA